jgi:hypothetical protein
VTIDDPHEIATPAQLIVAPDLPPFIISRRPTHALLTFARRNPTIVMGGLLLAVIVVIAVLAPWLFTADPRRSPRRVVFVRLPHSIGSGPTTLAGTFIRQDLVDRRFRLRRRCDVSGRPCGSALRLHTLARPYRDANHRWTHVDPVCPAVSEQTLGLSPAVLASAHEQSVPFTASRRPWRSRAVGRPPPRPRRQSR